MQFQVMTMVSGNVRLPAASVVPQTGKCGVLKIYFTIHYKNIFITSQERRWINLINSFSSILIRNLIQTLCHSQVLSVCHNQTLFLLCFHYVYHNTVLFPFPLFTPISSLLKVQDNMEYKWNNYCCGFRETGHDSEF
jgi:hypothetical protein